MSVLFRCAHIGGHWSFDIKCIAIANNEERTSTCTVLKIKSEAFYM